MANVQHFPDEDKAMRVSCYLIFAIAIAIWAGLLLYMILP